MSVNIFYCPLVCRDWRTYNRGRLAEGWSSPDERSDGCCLVIGSDSEGYVQT